MAMTVTHISAAAASIAWAVVEWLRYGKPSLVGIVTGMVAGLATITPASGFVGPLGGLLIGILAGLVCQWAVGMVKQRLKVDDSLDVFAVHGVGGALGTIILSVFASTALGGIGLADGMTIGSQLGVQIVGVVAVGLWSAVASFVIVKVVTALVGLRVDEETEIVGLDISAHGERAYDL
jgi:Amt family ammonium transporter